MEFDEAKIKPLKEKREKKHKHRNVGSENVEPSVLIESEDIKSNNTQVPANESDKYVDLKEIKEGKHEKDGNQRKEKKKRHKQRDAEDGITSQSLLTQDTEHHTDHKILTVEDNKSKTDNKEKKHKRVDKDIEDSIPFPDPKPEPGDNHATPPPVNGTIKGAHSTESRVKPRQTNGTAPAVTKLLETVHTKNDQLPFNHPQNHKAWRLRQQLLAKDPNIDPERLAMLTAAPPIPSEPVPSGPLIEGTDRRQWVIKDFLPFVTGSEWSRRRAERKGKPIRRSPRSIRKEARDLMQQRMIRDAVERGEEPPKFEKPLTRRQMREEKKAVKRDPAVRALKFQRRRLQREAQRIRNIEVKALREEGKQDEADTLSRQPLFRKFEVGDTESEHKGKKRKRSDEDEDEDGDDMDVSGTSDSDSSASSDSGSLTSDLSEYSSGEGEGEEELTEEQKAALKSKRRANREKRGAEKERKAANPKTKRQKTEARYAAMPTVPPPVLPVPTFQSVTKGIPLPFTKRRGSLKELKQILKDAGLSREEEQAYIHKALVDQQEAINIKQSRRAAMRRERKVKRKAKKHKKHIAVQQEMARNRREKLKRRAAGEEVELSSEKKKRKKAEREEKMRQMREAREARSAGEWVSL